MVVTRSRAVLSQQKSLELHATVVATPKKVPKAQEAIAKVATTALEVLEKVIWEKRGKEALQTLKAMIPKTKAKRALQQPEAQLKRICLRYEQIRSATHEKEPLTEGEALKLAFFIETKIHKVKETANRFFLKGQEGLCRSLQIDAASQDVFLIGDPELSCLQGGGTFKELRGAVRLPLKDFKKNPEIVAQLFTKVDVEELSALPKAKLKKEIKEIGEELEHTEKELSYCRRFRHIPGIATLYTDTTYHVTIQGEAVPRMSMLFKLAEGGDLQKKIQEKTPLQLEEEVNLAKQLVQFFATIHKGGVIHADIKPENILLYEDQKIGVTDFGLAFDWNKKKPRETTPSYMFGLGYYGTEKYSAPELFGNRTFTEKGDYAKADVWALGCLLYELHFRKASPGKMLIEKHDQENFDNDKLKFKDEEALQKAQRVFAKEVQNGPEKAFARLEKKKKAKGLSAKEQYEHLIYSMLRLDPTKRKL